MQIIEVPGHGEVEFPDDMNDDQIAAAIKRNLMVPKGKKEPTPFGERLVQKIGEPLMGAGQLIAKGVQAMAPEGSSPHKLAGSRLAEMDARRKELSQSYQAPEGMDWAGTLGNVIGSVPLALAVPGGGLASGIAAGAMSGATQPVEGDDFWKQKAKQAAFGSAMGGAGNVAARSLARVIKPNTSPDVELLHKAGVNLTPGQTLGGVSQRVEQGLSSIPGVGDFIKRGQRSAVEDMNKAVINKALEPIGKTLPMSTKAGREAVAEAGDLVSKTYDDLLPKLKVNVDDVLVSDLQGVVRTSLARLPETQQKQFQNILKADVFDPFASGSVSGNTVKDVESKLGYLIRKYGRSENPDHNLLADSFRETQVALRKAIERSNPEHVGELAAVNKAFASLLPIENAAGRAGSTEGIFSPKALTGGIRAMDPSKRKTAFARGRARGQTFAESAEDVLGQKVPDSGTPYRAIATGIGGGFIDPSIPIGMAAGGALYSDLGKKAMYGLLAQRPGQAAALAQQVRLLAPALSASLPPVYQGLLE